MTEAVPWIFAGLGALAAFFFSLRAQNAARELESARSQGETLAADLATARESLAEASNKLGNHNREVAELRKRIEKAKRRAAQGKSHAPNSSASETQALELELEQVRQTRDAARDEAGALSAELSRLRAELSRSRAETEQPLLDNAAIESLRERFSGLEAEVAKGREGLAAARKSEARLKKKLSTQELLYVSIRNELAAKKDRLRTQQEEVERLRALRVAFLDTPSETDSSDAGESASENPA
jgi:chromosome segregation ATPase